MSSTSYSLFIETYINSGGSFTCLGNRSSAAFLSLSDKKIKCIYIDLNKATLYEFPTCFIISYGPAI